jgi:hypothetical protein
MVNVIFCGFGEGMAGKPDDFEELFPGHYRKVYG